MRAVMLGLLLGVTLPLPGHAAVYTIGPDGAYATIVDAVADASANPDNHEFRLQTGTHDGGAILNVSGEKTWIITGGWNASFTENPVAPEQTNWQASVLGGTVLTFQLTATAQLLVENLTIRNGLGGSGPGGIWGALNDSSRFRLSACRVTGHQSVSQSAGMSVVANQTSAIDVIGCDFSLNATVGNGATFGAGAFVRTSNSASVSLSKSRFAFNQDSPTSSFSIGVGLSIEGRDASMVTLRDLAVVDNAMQSTTGSGAGLAIELSQDAVLDAEAVSIGGNSASNQVSGLRVQAYLVTFDTSDFAVRNCLVVNSALGGLAITVAGSGNGAVTNCTFARNQGIGIAYNASTGNHAVTNSIVHSNQDLFTYGIVLGPTVVGSHNLGDDIAGVNNLNPQFVNDTTDFHLQPGSPAIDAGSNTFNTTDFDLDASPRVVNGVVDIGAYESQTVPTDAVFDSGFESAP